MLDIKKINVVIESVHPCNYKQGVCESKPQAFYLQLFSQREFHFCFVQGSDTASQRFEEVNLEMYIMETYLFQI